MLLSFLLAAAHLYDGGGGQKKPPPRFAAYGEHSSQVETGNDFWTNCSGGNDSFCLGFVNGLGAGLQTGSYAIQHNRGEAPHAELFCAPATVTIGQAKDVFLKWLADHPADRQNPSEYLFYFAMRDAFPCPKTP